MKEFEIASGRWIKVITASLFVNAFVGARWVLAAASYRGRSSRRSCVWPTERGEHFGQGILAMKTLKTFHVLVLGTSAAGKTTLLASMYHRLGVQDPEVGFFLEVPEDQRKLLTDQFFRIANPETKWPDATREVKRWSFTCIHANSTKSIPALPFSYLDYGGLVVNEPISDLELNKEVKLADSLLVLIDGQSLLRHMDGSDSCGPGSLFYGLCYLLPLAMQAKPSTPCYFVVTKWDLLEDRCTLDQVRERLLEVDAFRAFVETRRQRSQTQGLRLIPVSSVGKGFARLNGNGAMEKCLNGGLPKPFQVELPIACSLIDGLKAARASLPEDPINPWLERVMRQKLLRGAINRFGFVVKCLSAVIGLPALLELIVPGLFRQLDVWLQKQEEELKQELKLKQQDIKDWGSAIEAMLIAHVLIMKRFEERFPSSDLALAV